ncbi:MAG: hypothetical protein RBS57_12885 [Desulforhabdus sp.]|nr:hypothetical protein [Desulforhabdus sp.]
MAELLPFITFIKILVSIAVVVLLSILAEVVSPRFAGVLSGYPLGAAITLFFFGLEISPEFAAASAIYTMAGLIATQAFAYTYYRASSWASRWSKLSNILFASVSGVFCYFLVAAALHQLQLNMALAVVLPSISIFLFILLFRRAQNVRIHQRVSLNPQVLLLRSAAAACFVIVITSTAKLVGVRWAGLFSAFPITMLPFVMIIHFTYDPEHVYAILKNVPKGIGSLIVYSLAVALLYPTVGIYLGTFLAYLLATFYLLILHFNCGPPGIAMPFHSRARRDQ